MSDAILAFSKRRCVEGLGLVLFGAAVALSLSLITWSVKDPSLNHATGRAVRNLLGAPGAVLSDLLIQIFGLGAAAAAFVPAVWGIRLIREGTMRRAGLRLTLWAVGIWALAAFASALPSTAAWPLPTGLGGVAGDALLGAARTVGGGLGVAVAGLIFGAVAASSLLGACGLRRAKSDPFSPPPERAQDREETGRDDEPSLAIIWLGGMAHGLISAKAALQRRIAARAAASAPLRPADRSDQHDRFDRLDRFDRPAPPVADAPFREPSRAPVAVPMPAPVRVPMPVPAPMPAPAAEPAMRASAEREILYTPPLRGPASRLRGVAPPVRVPEPGDLDGYERRGPGAMPEDVATPFGCRDDRQDEKDEMEENDLPPSPPQRAAAPAPSQIRMAAPVRAPAPSPAPLHRAAPMPAAAPGRAAVHLPAQVAPRAPAPAARSHGAAGYEMPPLPLLSEPRKQVATVSKDALEQNATLLESTLEDFGVRGEIINVRPGPVVTLYELEPAPGTKSSRVIGLADDIARSMSAVSARVAVVLGRNAIGIELPNQKRETVFLREL
ncbi:DNA translocase FtsK 4TM domain-containing protein, partial [Enterovirga sp.]|uniref:DNA translocase FtsK 4TM domain-containing protein n=1 Tax=Enterovirga sp. TaxID=2026350 RepID=UPI002C8B04AD